MELRLLVLVASTLDYKTLAGDYAFALGEEPAVPGRCGHEERRGQADENSEEAFKEEYVAP